MTSTGGAVHFTQFPGKTKTLVGLATNECRMVSTIEPELKTVDEPM